MATADETRKAWEAHSSQALYDVVTYLSRHDWSAAELEDARTHVNALNPEVFKFDPPKDEPTPTKPFLGFWGGQNIPSWYQGYEQIFAQVKQLAAPYGDKFGPLEWYPKAGEGGSWQARYLHPTWGDPHPLAIDGPGAIRTMVEMGKSDGVSVNPYVNVRGRPAWMEGEWRQICEIMLQGVGRVILNLENGSEFWNGPTDPDGVQRWWDGLYRTSDEMGLGDRLKTEIATIPRPSVYRALGGSETMRTWLKNADMASWECYDGVASDLGPASLLTVNPLAPDDGPQWRIPICQRNRMEVWSRMDLTNYGMEVWYLDGNY